jgi:hypothetical protein
MERGSELVIDLPWNLSEQPGPLDELTASQRNFRWYRGVDGLSESSAQRRAPTHVSTIQANAYEAVHRFRAAR